MPITTREHLQSSLLELAKVSQTLNEPTIAVVLLTLCGSIGLNSDRELAGLCAEFSKKQLGDINQHIADKKAQSN